MIIRDDLYPMAAVGTTPRSRCRISILLSTSQVLIWYLIQFGHWNRRCFHSFCVWHILLCAGMFRKWFVYVFCYVSQTYSMEVCSSPPFAAIFVCGLKLKRMQKWDVFGDWYCYLCLTQFLSFSFVTRHKTCEI